MAWTETYAAEQRAIMQRLADNWTGTAIKWPNTANLPDEEPYVEPIVNRGQAFNASVGSTVVVRHPGILTLNIWTPLNEGDADGFQFADELAAVFRNTTVGSITFRAPTVRDLGPEGARYRVQVDCPFWRDSLFTVS